MTEVERRRGGHPKAAHFPSLSSSLSVYSHTPSSSFHFRETVRTHSTFCTVKGPKSNVELFIFMRQTHLTSRNKTENLALTPYASAAPSQYGLFVKSGLLSPLPLLYIPGMPSGAPFPSSPPLLSSNARSGRERREDVLGGVFPAGGERRDGYYGWSPPLHSFPPRFIYPGAGFTKWNTLSVESGGGNFDLTQS